MNNNIYLAPGREELQKELELASIDIAKQARISEVKRFHADAVPHASLGRMTSEMVESIAAGIESTISNSSNPDEDMPAYIEWTPVLASIDYTQLAVVALLHLYRFSFMGEEDSMSCAAYASAVGEQVRNETLFSHIQNSDEKLADRFCKVQTYKTTNQRWSDLTDEVLRELTGITDSDVSHEELITKLQDIKKLELEETLDALEKNWKSTKQSWGRLRSAAARLLTSDGSWDTATTIKIGAALIKIAIDSCEVMIGENKVRVFDSNLNYATSNKSLYSFRLNDAVIEEMRMTELAWVHRAQGFPIFVVPPRPMIDYIDRPEQWTPFWHKDSLPIGIMKSSLHGAHGSGEEGAANLSEDFIREIDKLASTAWRINIPVYRVMKETWRLQKEMESNLDAPLKGLVDSLPTTVKLDNQRLRQSNNSKLQSWESLLDIATEYCHLQPLYFPYQTDFRGRLYALPSPLSFQGADPAKGVLEFFEGTEYGDDGYEWMLLHAANSLGKDKGPFSQRRQYVLDHKEEIRTVAGNPLWKGNQNFWGALESPWQALAAIMELARYWDWVDAGKDGRQFVGHVPVALDGACNGCQHLAAFTRDEVAGNRVHLTREAADTDLYTSHADAMLEVVKHDAEQWRQWMWTNPEDAWITKTFDNGGTKTEYTAAAPLPGSNRTNGNHAEFWLDKLSRSLVKTPVMTKPYGVTNEGIIEQLRKNGHELQLFSEEDPTVRAKCSYLGQACTKAFGTSLRGPDEAMHFFRELASYLTSIGEKLVWTTPVGNVIQQWYPKTKEKRVSTLLASITLQVVTDSGKSTSQKAKSSSSPNIIHSFDASHMAMTFALMDDSCPRGAVHDSFAVPAGQAKELSVAVRQAWLNIYNPDIDYFTNLINETEERLGQLLPDRFHAYTDERVELTEAEVKKQKRKTEPGLLPRFGSLDLNEIMDSECFFG